MHKRISSVIRTCFPYKVLYIYLFLLYPLGTPYRITFCRCGRTMQITVKNSWLIIYSLNEAEWNNTKMLENYLQLWEMLQWPILSMNAYTYVFNITLSERSRLLHSFSLYNTNTKRTSLCNSTVIQTEVYVPLWYPTLPKNMLTEAITKLK